MSSIRVVVADDAADLRGVIRMLLDLEDDFEVVGEARDGGEAVRLSAEHQPDLVVLDVAMPVLDGLAALEHVRAAAPAAKVVMFSADDSATVIDRARESGAAGYIDKATGVVDLVERLRKVCLPD
jgi:DNA-binding NarL/FixJ family response regulator